MPSILDTIDNTSGLSTHKCLIIAAFTSRGRSIGHVIKHLNFECGRSFDLNQAQGTFEGLPAQAFDTSRVRRKDKYLSGKHTHKRSAPKASTALLKLMQRGS